METGDRVSEDRLERGLLSDHNGNSVDEDGEVAVYKASFEEMEESFVKYQTAWWILYSLLLVLVWGVGFLMLLYLPVRRYTSRHDIRSRKLYLTRNAIVYKVRRPVWFPCFGVHEKEKHVILPSVADVVVEQGFLQSLFGVYSVRIENAGVRRPPSDDFQIQGLTNPVEFREAILAHLSDCRENVDTPRMRVSSVASISASRSPGLDSFSQLIEAAVWEKLDEVCSTVKKIEALITEQNLGTSVSKLKSETPEE